MGKEKNIKKKLLYEKGKGGGGKHLPKRNEKKSLRVKAHLIKSKQEKFKKKTEQKRKKRKEKRKWRPPLAKGILAGTNKAKKKKKGRRRVPKGQPGPGNDGFSREWTK